MRLTCAAILLLLSLLAPIERPCFPQTPPAGPDYGKIVSHAIVMLQTEHPRHLSIDDQVSRRWFARFFDFLDPRRLYFLEEDIREFHVYQTRLDELGKAGEVRFPRLVRDRYRQRVKEATDYAKTLLDVEHDFTLNEEFSIDFDYYAVDDSERKERWRLRVKSEMLIERLPKRTPDEIKGYLAERYDRLQQRAAETPDERLYANYINALASVIDPHCNYLSEEILRSYRTSMIRPMTLGLEFTRDLRRFVIREVSPELRYAGAAVIGRELLSIQRLDGRRFDLVDATTGDYHRLVWGPRTPLGEIGDEVILDLWNPRTLKRTSVSWPLRSAVKNSR